MIKYYDRKTKTYNVENVAGDKSLKLIYDNSIGKAFLPKLVSRKIFSQIYGSLCDCAISKSAINKFITKFNINMNDYKKSANEYSSFNDFFYRQLSCNSRPIDVEQKHLISPCDSKLLAIENLSEDSSFFVKGFKYSLKDLINNDKLSEEYKNGTCLIFRLCPTDYHRFHFVDSGKCSSSKFINGKYYSVNPIALDKIEKLFCENKREYSIHHTDNFDDIIYVEVGATFVGSIIQTYKPSVSVTKGEEKGYFKFGGSTVIMFIKNNIVKLDRDILDNSKLNIETQVYMGEKIGVRV